MSGPHGVLVVDKPRGPTSHDIVRDARRALGTRSVGHAGTLDPMATGVLVVVVGEATKLVPWLTVDDKAYEAELRLGVATDSLDADGREVERAPVPAGLDRAAVERAAAGFLGVTRQRAPRVSAIKQGGKALHARVRAGEVVEPPEREVVLHELRVLAVEPPTIRVALVCGKGFYVRALGRDLAEALGTVGHLTALRRTRSGALDLSRAVPGAGLREAGDGLRARLLTLEEATSRMATVTLTVEGREDARHGRPIRPAGCEGGLPELSPDAVVRLLSPRGELVALGRRHEDVLRVTRGIVRD